MVNEMKESLQSSLKSIDFVLTKFTNSYKEFITTNPKAVLNIEKVLKTISYLYEAFAKNYSTSIFISEIVSATDKLFSYANACLLLKQSNSSFIKGKVYKNILHLLTVVEFSQAFLEMTAEKALGKKSKWFIICIITVIKVVLRLVLLFFYQNGIHISESQKLLNHKGLIEKFQQNKTPDEDLYMGKNSSLVMKTLNYPRTDSRRWSDTQDKWLHEMCNLPPSKLSKIETLGEVLSISRPLIHIITSSLAKKNSYFPWIASLITDASALALLNREPNGKEKAYKKIEALEIRRRYFLLWLYLLRSPVYDKYTGPCSLPVTQFLSNNVPLANYLLEYVNKYLVAWKHVYFYNWKE